MRTTPQGVHQSGLGTDVNLRTYLMDVLPRLGDWPTTRVAELASAAWKAVHLKIS